MSFSWGVRFLAAGFFGARFATLTGFLAAAFAIVHRTILEMDRK